MLIHKQMLPWKSLWAPQSTHECAMDETHGLEQPWNWIINCHMGRRKQQTTDNVLLFLKTCSWGVIFKAMLMKTSREFPTLKVGVQVFFIFIFLCICFLLSLLITLMHLCLVKVLFSYFLKIILLSKDFWMVHTVNC